MSEERVPGKSLKCLDRSHHEDILKSNYTFDENLILLILFQANIGASLNLRL